MAGPSQPRRCTSRPRVRQDLHGGLYPLFELFLKTVGSEGFHQTIGNTGLNGGHHARPLRFGGDHDDRNLLIPLTDSFEQRQPVHHRHVPIAEHDVERLFQEVFEGLLAVLGIDNVLNSKSVQTPLLNDAHGARIVNKQNFHGSRSYL